MEISPYQNQTDMSAILARNVTKRYEKKAPPILNQLDVTVPKGSIYSLLGPSGCGKTTLLRCVIGLTSIDNGYINVFGKPQIKQEQAILGPDIGYMPQDVALAEELSIDETFLYYGSLVGMDPKQIKSRAKYLLKLLHLPVGGRFLCELSGGQKRRVSFATAILHEPTLLILDEPTVGVDPPLRKKMWGFLSQLVRESNTTIIITTHYIEEARVSQMVGMMINGKLLAEAPPESLISKYNKSTLEDVFLHLCILKHERLSSLNDDSSKDLVDLDETNQNHISKGSVKNTTCSDNLKMVSSEFPVNKVDQESCKRQPMTINLSRRVYNFLKPPSFYRMFAVMLKNIARIYHHPASVMYQMILPAVIMICVCSSLGRKLHDINIAVIDEDHDMASQFFLNSIDRSIINLRNFKNYSSAYQEVQHGDIKGIIQINKNFTQNVISRYAFALSVDADVLEQSRLEMTLDISNSMIYNLVRLELYKSFQNAIQKALNRIGFNGILADIPILLSEPIYGGSDVTFQQYIMPGIAVSIIFFLSMDATSISLLTERKSGQMERSIVAGVTPTEVIIGNMVSQIIIMIVQTGIICVITLGIFGIPCTGSWVVFAIISIAQGLSGLSYGMCISAISSQEYGAVMMTLATVLPILILSGCFWPLDGMPVIFQKFAVLLPTTLPSQALRGVMGRGWSLLNFNVLLGLGVCFIWFGIFLFMAVLLFRRLW